MVLDYFYDSHLRSLHSYVNIPIYYVGQLQTILVKTRGQMSVLR